MEFFTNFGKLFQYPFQDQGLEELYDKIQNAQTDEERAMYEKELNDRMIYPYWWM